MDTLLKNFYHCKNVYSFKHIILPLKSVFLIYFFKEARQSTDVYMLKRKKDTGKGKC